MHRDINTPESVKKMRPRECIGYSFCLVSLENEMREGHAVCHQYNLYEN